MDAIVMFYLPMYIQTLTLSVLAGSYALTFLHSVFWIKARGRLVLCCCLFGLMEVPSLSPYHYRLIMFMQLL